MRPPSPGLISATAPPHDRGDFILRAIQRAVLDETERVTEEEIVLAQKRIETRVRAATAQISAQVFSHFEMSRVRDELCITVRFPSDDKKAPNAPT